MLNLISTNEIESHALDFDALEGWCGNFYTHKTRVSRTWFSFIHLRMNKKNKEEERNRKKEKKKKEGKEEEEEEEETHGKTIPTPWSHLQNQTHPQQNQIHPFVAISTCKTKPTCNLLLLRVLQICLIFLLQSINWVDSWLLKSRFGL